MFPSIGIRIEGENLASFAQQMYKVPSVPASGVEHPHPLCDIPAQDLIEHINIYLAELLLDTEHQRAVQPPSITNVCPVMSEAAGEARKTTAPATSIGSPMRCKAAMRSITSWRKAGSARAPSVPGVWMKVGATAFTLMLYLPHSTARHLVRWTMPALVMQ